MIQKVSILVPKPSSLKINLNKWFYKSGEHVNFDDCLFMLEAKCFTGEGGFGNKDMNDYDASCEFPAPATGILEILVNSGEVEVGQVIGYSRVELQIDRLILSCFFENLFCSRNRIFKPAIVYIRPED